LKLIRNAVQCNSCNEIIESKHRHDFVKCSCGDVAVDGGLDYKRFLWMDSADWTELYEYEELDNSREETNV